MAGRLLLEACFDAFEVAKVALVNDIEVLALFGNLGQVELRVNDVQRVNILCRVGANLQALNFALNGEDLLNAGSNS